MGTANARTRRRAQSEFVRETGRARRTIYQPPEITATSQLVRINNKRAIHRPRRPDFSGLPDFRTSLRDGFLTRRVAHRNVAARPTSRLRGGGVAWPDRSGSRGSSRGATRGVSSRPPPPDRRDSRSRSPLPQSRSPPVRDSSRVQRAPFRGNAPCARGLQWRGDPRFQPVEAPPENQTSMRHETKRTAN